MMSNTYIIIPCYNEGTVARNTAEKLLKAGYNVVIVDDGSEKSLLPLMKNLPLHFLRHTVNLGQGAALQTGMDYCKSLGADRVVHFDGDGQHDLDDIPAFLKALDTYDVALGSRFLTDAGAGNIPVFRRFLLKTARLVNFCFTGLWLSDAHNGFRALGPKALNAVEITENRMAHATELPAQFKKHRLTLTEIPVNIKYTDYSRAKGQKWYNSLNILIDLILSKFL